jgi:glycosyltransferase involved in cell wall biosynthesis
MAKPIVTTDSIGCRETVEDGVNGFLCRPRDAGDLADKIIRFIRLSEEDRRRMGGRGREKARAQFDERIVIDRYLAEISRLQTLAAPPAGEQPMASP